MRSVGSRVRLMTWHRRGVAKAHRPPASANASEPPTALVFGFGARNTVNAYMFDV